MASKSKIGELKIRDICNILFESAGEGLIVTDDAGVIRIANPSVEDMFGYENKELIGQKVELLLPEKFRRKHVGHRKEYNAHPSKRAMGIGIDLTGQRKDGSVFPVEISLNHFKVDSKKMVIALVSDITARKKIQVELQKLNDKLEEQVKQRTQQLESSQQLYETIARNFPNGVINVLDKDLNYVFVEGMEMYKRGITGEMLIGTSFLKRVDKAIQNDIKKQLQAVFGGENVNTELKLEGKTYMVNAVGLHGPDNKIDRVLLVTQNITSLKKAEEGIQLMLENERHLNELKSRFVSMASHEFRTPLTTVLNSISLLSKYIGVPDNEEKQHKHIERIKSSVHHLTSILNDFLSLDKLEEGKVEMRYSEFDLYEFSREIVKDMQDIAKNGQKISYGHKGKSDVYLDKQMLMNIFNNLLSNAIKYSTENSIVRFETSIENGNMTALVKDQGMGIPEEEQEHLFERFFRAKNALNIQGTGLGLNIVKKYVEMAGGDIKFDSKSGNGTTFIVRLPINEK